jgi:hypothetical protein
MYIPTSKDKGCMDERKYGKLTVYTVNVGPHINTYNNLLF